MEDHGVKYLEFGQVDADAERQYGDGSEGKGGGLAEDAGTAGEVLTSLSEDNHGFQV